MSINDFYVTIRPNTLDKKYSRLFERLHKNREIADYNAIAPKFDREDANTFMNEFAELTPEILKFLHNFKTQTDNIIRLTKELKGLIKK